MMAISVEWAWFVLFAPLAASCLILLFGRSSRILCAALALGSAVAGCAVSWWLFLENVQGAATRWIWLTQGLGEFAAIGIRLDALSAPMLLLVTTVASLVFLYSLGYMRKEEGWWRYFAGLSLFLFSMLGIVLADNFVMMFIFWELVGVSSYLLIGHYFWKDSAADAGKQAFLVNRVGDFGFLLGILLFTILAGTTVFTTLAENAPMVAGHTPGLFGLACVLVFCGAMGKSAQFPLHVWLPNSMEGPTPVSSLLHAATMVAAGVYMLARVFPVLACSQVALTVIAWVGTITCLGAALMATQQNDIKRILAYSTISQLGYMMLGIGVASGYDASIFHLFTHACFKCLLFLCAGSVIFGLHHEQNIWKMGGVWRKMPVTFICALVGALALAGCPFLSGYYSKDNIILWAMEKNPVLGWVAVLTAGITAFYIFRFIIVVFFGKARSEGAKHAHESPAVMLVSLLVLALASVVAGWPVVSNFLLGSIVLPEEPAHAAEWVLKILFAVGVAGAFFLYGRGGEEKVSIALFANRFYIDDFYARLVAVCQDGTARVADWCERWLVQGVTIWLPGRLAWGCGFLMRFLQSGSTQAYVFFFAAGVVALLYILLS